MKLQLMGYQIDAVTDTVFALKDAADRYAKAQKLAAVSLSAPTGAGKTVIAAAVFERMWFGDEETEPNPGLTILWVTDDPSLNVQTKRKLLTASSQIKAVQLISVDPSFDQKTFDPGSLYFIHIQQLGKGATNYQRKSDRRQWSVWETIANTVETRGGNFLLVIDEAHRGTGTRNKSGGKTIAAQLIDGAGGKLPPAPVVLGISATPDRFNDAMTKAGRVLDPVEVDREAVIESGLVKDKIRIRHPLDKQPGDSTLLELAVGDLKAYDQLWSGYSAEQGEPPVMPALVLQVKAKTTNAELQVILETLAGAWNLLDGKAIGHSFQEHATLSLGTRSVRYVAPQDIQDDPYLRVVLFKEALTTGWDCPRAEVMLSFRPAADATYIAQLIGRMVRTPLARRIATNYVLNTVGLFLPHFDEKTVGRVIADLEADEGQLPDIEVDSVTCGQNPKVPSHIWDLLDGLPTYTRPTKNHRSDVARLNALAVLLAGNGLDPGAPSKAHRHLVATLQAEANRLVDVVDAAAQDLEDLVYAVKELDLASGETTTDTAHVLLNARNIDDLFRRARRILGDAAAKWYWEELCDEGTDPDRAKLQVSALAADPTVPNALETGAKTLIDNWRHEHNSAINDLPDAKRAAFYTIWQQSRSPQQITMIMPTAITTPGHDQRHPKHIYANGRGMFPAVFTGWEKDVLGLELGKTTLKAWYRNPTGGASALGVPYQQGTTPRTLYPDFIFFHEINGELVIDVVDPHRPDRSDTAPKWIGLAKYAETHGDYFRRVLAVIRDAGDTLISLDLKNPEVAEHLAKASNETEIRQIFSSLGGPY